MNTASSRPITLHGEESAPPETSGELKRPDLRSLVAAEFTALLNREATRRNDEWRATLELVRGALAALDRSWGATSGKLESSPPAAAVSDLVEVILAAVRRDTEAAVRQARVEAQVEIARSGDLVGRLNAELQTEREQLKATREAITMERDLRARAEAVFREAERDKAHLAAQLAAHSEAAQTELEKGRALVAQLRQQIEGEKNERAKLFAVVQSVQRAVSSGKPDSSESLVSAPIAPAVEDRDSMDHADRVRVGGTTGPAKILTGFPAIAKDVSATAPAAGQPASEKLWNPTLVTVTERLFEEIERKHLIDLQANLKPADVVDRLTANLRDGHADLRRSCTSDAEANGLFERQMMMLLDSKAATTFGRHLSIAACEWVVPNDRRTMNG